MAQDSRSSGQTSTLGISRPGSDARYKTLFRNPPMVASLLRHVLPSELVHALDLNTLERLPTDYIGSNLRQRFGDMLWRVRLRAGETLADDALPYVLVLLEFQSAPDRTMAVRMLDYTAVVIHDLLRCGILKREDSLPMIVPVVVYNGDRPWTSGTGLAALNSPSLVAAAGGPATLGLAAQQGNAFQLEDVGAVALEMLPKGEPLRLLAALEQARDVRQLARRLGRVFAELAGDGHRSLRRGMYVAAERVAATFGVALTPFEELDQGSNVETLTKLEANMMRWRDGVHAEGMRQGEEHGIRRGSAEGRRTLIVRLAARRFGSGTAARLERILVPVKDADLLDDVGEWLLDCESGAEFLVRVREALGAG